MLHVLILTENIRNAKYISCNGYRITHGKSSSTTPRIPERFGRNETNFSRKFTKPGEEKVRCWYSRSKDTSSSPSFDGFEEIVTNVGNHIEPFHGCRSPVTPAPFCQEVTADWQESKALYEERLWGATLSGNVRRGIFMSTFRIAIMWPRAHGAKR